MNENRNKLKFLIKETESVIQENRKELLQHQKYFSPLFSNNFFIVSSFIFPAAFLGWKLGKKIQLRGDFVKKLRLIGNLIFPYFLKILR